MDGGESRWTPRDGVTWHFVRRTPRASSVFALPTVRNRQVIVSSPIVGSSFPEYHEPERRDSVGRVRSAEFDPLRLEQRAPQVFGPCLEWSIIVVNYDAESQVGKVWVLWEAEDQFFSARKANSNARTVDFTTATANVEIIQDRRASRRGRAAQN
jgi:hypothetical protein